MGSGIDRGSIDVPAVLMRFSHRRDADVSCGRNQTTSVLENGGASRLPKESIFSSNATLAQVWLRLGLRPSSTGY